ncbi:MAG: protein kinase [Rhodanobacteraceae bacterium]|nr:protein kinase [Rhodanobacteraceae bacterium]
MGAPDDLSRHIQDNPNREYYHATVTVKGYHDDAPASKVVLKASLVHLELILQFQNLEPSFQASLTSIVENHFPKASSQFSQRPEEKRVRETRELQPGMEIDCYRLLQRLGSGMSGEVWKARVERTPPGVGLRPSESVAMKHYFESPLRGAELIRVHREFLVASKLRHPNLVRVFDLLLSPSRPFHSFLVMEHVEGRTLKAQIPNQGFDVKKVIDIGVQIVWGHRGTAWAKCTTQRYKSGQHHDAPYE